MPLHGCPEDAPYYGRYEDGVWCTNAEDDAAPELIDDDEETTPLPVETMRDVVERRR